MLGGHLLLCPEMAPGKKAEVLDIFIVSTNFPQDSVKASMISWLFEFSSVLTFELFAILMNVYGQI